nr:DUF6516 family protein [Natrinema limicola]
MKYAFHYGVAGADDPIIRFDNHHGIHELHLDSEVYETDYLGLQTLYRAIGYNNQQMSHAVVAYGTSERVDIITTLQLH